MSEWQPLTESFPETGMPVWVVAGGYVQHVAYELNHDPEGWSDEEQDHDFWTTAIDVEGDSFMRLWDVSHWMPLPAPPTE